MWADKCSHIYLNLQAHMVHGQISQFHEPKIQPVSAARFVARNSAATWFILYISKSSKRRARTHLEVQFLDFRLRLVQTRFLGTDRPSLLNR